MKFFSKLSLVAATAILPTLANAQQVVPQPNAPISAARQRAAVIFQRLTGVKVGIDAEILQQMEERILAGDQLGAAALVTGTDANSGNPAFLDITVRQMATKMSTREETVKAPFSDFVATFMGVVRDNIDARELLRGNFYYAGSAAAVPNNQNLVADILKSNNHYNALGNITNRSIASVLERRNGQMVANGDNAVPNPDPAGLITSRAFTEAHAVAGTNRRMVHYTFKMFLCIDMEGWATTDSPDNRVGPDVDRAQGGDPSVFQKTCKGCHGNMDGLRGAFANLDFANNYLKHGMVLNNVDNNGVNADNVGANNFPRARFNNVSYQGVASKYVRNANVFPGGYFTRDASWINTATTGGNASYFGWRSPKDENGNIVGYGINAYGRMLSESEAFSRCMVRRVYEQVCNREPSAAESGVVRDIASDFEREGYNFRRLFQRVATNSACIGK